MDKGLKDEDAVPCCAMRCHVNMLVIAGPEVDSQGLLSGPWGDALRAAVPLGRPELGKGDETR